MEERAPIVFANQNLAAAGGTSLATSINWKAGVLRSSAALYQDAESRLAGIEDTSERKVDGVGASGLSGNNSTATLTASSALAAAASSLSSIDEDRNA
jgi:hypothetical protein